MPKDVVPKSEVKCIYAYDGEVEEYCVQSPCPNYKTIEQAKQEVAREIFEEIDKLISSTEYTPQTRRKTIEVKELKEQVDWVLHEGVPQLIAELKKKYTESEDKV